MSVRIHDEVTNVNKGENQMEGDFCSDKRLKKAFFRRYVVFLNLYLGNIKPY